MFEQALIDKFKTIFDVAKVTFDAPSPENKEQETLFIDVSLSKNTFRDGFAQARVQGKAFMFAQTGKLPFAFFSKAIEEHPTDAKDVFFYEFESNTERHENIVQRGFSFIYFFTSQFDPDIGTLTSIETEVTET